jgi:hypothetical protein
MKDHQLDNLLKNLKVPNESAEFRENLAQDVFRELKRNPSRSQAPVAGNSWAAIGPRLIFAGAWAATAILLLLVLVNKRTEFVPGITDQQLSEARSYYSELAALFPRQLRAVVIGRNASPTLVLAETPDVPEGEPVLVQFTSPTSRSSFIVINGQDFSFEGKRYEVLLDHQGGVLVVGPDCAWSSRETSALHGPLQIAARSLDIAS